MLHFPASIDIIGSQTMMMMIQFNSILYYLCAVSTAVRPITDTAQCTLIVKPEENTNK
jgi:hypothetical protein